MYVERLLYPVMVLGVGQRIVIWTQGCTHGCKDCINKELWGQRKENNISIEKLINIVRWLVKNRRVDGITITGGDPFYQLEELYEFVRALQQMGLEILVYSGYTRAEITKMKYGSEVLDIVDVLIDGKYIEELNDNASALRGSTNQVIYYKNKEIEEKYMNYLQRGRELQQFYCDDHMVSVGIHDRRLVDGNHG